MTVTLEMVSEQDRGVPCDCPPSRCRFRVSLVRMYLAAYRQSRIVREPFADVLQDCVRNSREIDPWTRGGRVLDRDACRDIAISMELARDRLGIELIPWNAERLARALCPTRWDEA